MSRYYSSHRVKYKEYLLKKTNLIDKFFEKEKIEKLKRLDVTSKEVKKIIWKLKSKC